jgi:GT2 family glycosyltransferase
MKISVVIPTHFRASTLTRLLHSLSRQSLPRDEFEALVVSNQPDDFFTTPQFKQLTQSYQCQSLVVGKVGGNSARNLGIKQSQGQIVVLLDDDCELIDPDFLEKIYAYHSRNPKLTAVGGTYVVAQDASAIDKAYNIIATAWQQPKEYGHNHSWRLLGGNVSYKKSVLHDHSLYFNEDLVYGGTETELHLRMQQMGLSAALIHGFKVQHNTCLTVDDLIRKALSQASAQRRYGASGEPVGSTGLYHSIPVLLAWEASTTTEEMQKIMEYVDLYDFAYHYHDSRVSSAKLLKHWQKNTSFSSEAYYGVDLD